MAAITEPPEQQTRFLKLIHEADQKLTERFTCKMRVNQDLDRSLVSFQANKGENGYRWFKYREGFSATLVNYMMEQAGLVRGRILDPFAGSGTTLFTAAERGLDSVGIELLPSSIAAIEVRNAVVQAGYHRIIRGLREALDKRVWEQPGEVVRFSHLRITAGAFPAENERQLGRFIFEAAKLEDRLLAKLLHFAAMCVLEEISFTRKDGQFLRWDQRSGRCLGRGAFDKGTIRVFNQAISSKLNQIADDLGGKGHELTLFCNDQAPATPGKIEILAGSCLDIIPTMEDGSIDGLITSPPYCNRYDYTRTYALELAMLGLGEDGLRDLRQRMLSCTVENREKLDLPEKFGPRVFAAASAAFDSQKMLSLLLGYLEQCKEDATINNPGIARMVRNYFFEMSLLIFASAKILKVGSPFVMVNDNVRFEGAHIPVDLILSDLAEAAGFAVDAIWVLPRGKGNSSQQMGVHGRKEVRKCVYIWRKK